MLQDQRELGVEVAALDVAAMCSSAQSTYHQGQVEQALRSKLEQQLLTRARIDTFSVVVQRAGAQTVDACDAQF